VKWERHRRCVIAMAIAAVIGGCASRPVAANSAPAAPAGEPAWQQVALGLCEDYPEESRSLEAARADLVAAREVGARVLRVAFGWDAMEPEQGKFDWSFWDEFVRMASGEFGLRLIPYVCYTPRWAASDPGPDFWRSPPRDPEDFARFMRVIVDRYRDAISSWELWNEPDNRAYWLGTPAQFAALVRAGSRAVRATDPRDQVVLGGIAGETEFLETLFATERIAPAVDVVNVHCYFETWHPDPIETLTSYVERAAQILREHGEGEPLWMAELGYSSVAGRAQVSEVYRAFHVGEHTAVAQANALARKAVLTLASGKIELFAWYRINDLPATQEVIGDDNNLHLGIRDVAGRPKPAFAALRHVIDFFAQPYARLSPRVACPPVDGTVNVHAFQLRDGRSVVAAWLGRSAKHAPAEPAPDGRVARVRVDLPGTFARTVRFADALGWRQDSPQFRWHAQPEGTALELVLHGANVVFAELLPPR
jgi:hypothetical protein